MSIALFTPKPRRVTQAGPCSFWETFEVRHYRSVSLTLKVIGFEGATAPLLWIAMETSMNPDRDFGSLGRFDTIAVDGGVSQVNFDHLMRYVRWNVVQFEGAAAAYFTLEGTAST